MKFDLIMFLLKLFLVVPVLAYILNANIFKILQFLGLKFDKKKEWKCWFPVYLFSIIFSFPIQNFLRDDPTTVMSLAPTVLFKLFVIYPIVCLGYLLAIFMFLNVLGVRIERKTKLNIFFPALVIVVVLYSYFYLNS